MWLIAGLLALSLGQAAPGKLFLVGGGRTPEIIPKRFIEECGGPESLIIVMPLASATPETSQGSVEYLKEHGAKNVVHFGKASLEDADRAALAKLLSEARGLWMPGGQQHRIVERLGKEWCDAHIKPAVARGMHVYGTSAGAMVCSNPMIIGNAEEANTPRVNAGFGLTTYMVDTHFSQRSREPRLRKGMDMTKTEKGIGLSESGWVVIQGDRILEKHGETLVIEQTRASGKDSLIFSLANREVFATISIIGLRAVRHPL